MNDYHSEFKLILKKLGFEDNAHYTHYGLLEGYEGLIESLSKEYDWNIEEFDNDIFIREVIEVILVSKSLKIYNEYDEFQNRIMELDQKLKEISYPYIRQHDKKWWENIILKNGGPTYNEDVFMNYGINKK